MEVSTTKIILASGSPRRKELLSDLGYQFDIIIPNLDESLLPRENPSEHVLILS
ncbi:MAG TPA: septum formation inhibitor Maf, partial [candidate division Zixibacteria bacterium]|nr:septum formation inhibitor Maf [candidate division Zixibacteria bacterium]